MGQAHQDIALHINPRLPQNYVVRNSKINGRWGKEETTSAFPFTLQRGEPFAIQILVTEPEFLISINGKHFASFAHRIPFDRITTLQVIGDVSDVNVQQVPVQLYPDKQYRELDQHVKSMDRVEQVETGEYLVSSDIFGFHLQFYFIQWSTY